MTLEELSKLLDKNFREYIKFPDLEVSMVKYRRINFNILGEVERPGFYSIEGSSENNLLATQNSYPNNNDNPFPILYEQNTSKISNQKFLKNTKGYIDPNTHFSYSF